MSTEDLQASILGALADLAGDAEPSLETVVHAKDIALQAQFAALNADLERMQRVEAEQHEAKERPRTIRMRTTRAECVAEHEAEEARKADIARRIEHDRLNGTPWSGPGFDRLPDGTRVNIKQIYLPDRSSTADADYPTPAVGARADRNTYETEPEPDYGTYEDHRRRLLGPTT